MDTYICMGESLCYAPETITTLLISYKIQNEKSKTKKKKQPTTQIKGETFLFNQFHDYEMD